MKKILSLFLCAVCLFSLASVSQGSVLAAGEKPAANADLMQARTETSGSGVRLLMYRQLLCRFKTVLRTTKTVL